MQTYKEYTCDNVVDKPISQLQPYPHTNLATVAAYDDARKNTINKISKLKVSIRLLDEFIVMDSDKFSKCIINTTDNIIDILCNKADDILKLKEEFAYFSNQDMADDVTLNDIQKDIYEQQIKKLRSYKSTLQNDINNIAKCGNINMIF